MVALGEAPNNIYMFFPNNDFWQPFMHDLFGAGQKGKARQSSKAIFCLCQQSVTLMEYSHKNVLLTFVKLRTVGTCVWICRVSGHFSKS